MKGYSLALTSAVALTRRDPAYTATLPPMTRRRVTKLGKRKDGTLYPVTPPCGCEGPHTVCEETRSHDTVARLASTPKRYDGLTVRKQDAAKKEEAAKDYLARVRAELAAASWRK